MGLQHVDIDAAAAAPVLTARSPGQKVLVYQVAAQRAVVIDQRFEDLIDGRFRVTPARLEGLGHLVEKLTPTGPLGRHRRDPAVPYERPELLRRMAQKPPTTFHISSMPKLAPIAKRVDCAIDTPG